MTIPLIEAHSSTPFSTRYGEFTLHAYELSDGARHAALVSGGLQGPLDELLLRLQSACLTGVAFGASLCDCRQQLELALSEMAIRPGVLLYLDQEGRGHGWERKVAELNLMRTKELDTVEAAATLGLEVDLREYDSSRAVLEDLFGSLPQVRLLTNNPNRIASLRAAGFEIIERIPIEPPATPENRPYLLVKQRKLGHLLSGLE
jgi:GTP cyclohydrolase II